VLLEPGDMAVIWLHGRADAAAIKDPPHAHLRLSGYPESECVPIIEFEQLNPPKRYAVLLSKIKKISRVHSMWTASQLKGTLPKNRAARHPSGGFLRISLT
jgi:hypothetical protein